MTDKISERKRKRKRKKKRKHNDTMTSLFVGKRKAKSNITHMSLHVEDGNKCGTWWKDEGGKSNSLYVDFFLLKKIIPSLLNLKNYKSLLIINRDF